MGVFIKQHALKGQKLLAQGNALGIKAISNTPCKGKSFKIHIIKMVNQLRYVKLLPLQGDKFANMITPRALPWAMSFCPLPFRYAPVTVGSGRVGLTCET